MSTVLSLPPAGLSDACGALLRARPSVHALDVNLSGNPVTGARRAQLSRGWAAKTK